MEQAKVSWLRKDTWKVIANENLTIEQAARREANANNVITFEVAAGDAGRVHISRQEHLVSDALRWSTRGSVVVRDI